MDEARNLAKLFEHVNRAEFARTYKVPGGQSMIYQHITGRKPISLDCAVAYAIGFKRPLSDISKRLAKLVSKLPSADINDYRVGEDNKEYHVNFNSDESLLLRAFRLAPAEVRLIWLDQAKGILARLNTPSQLTGND